MAKSEEKVRAIKLRRKGYSIKEIAESLHVSKGSVSIWCQNISLTSQQIKRLKEKQVRSGDVGRQIGANKNKEKRLGVIRGHRNAAIKIISTLSQRDILLLGIGLYWGEGVKSRSGMASLVNSDPDIIRLGKVWFEMCLGVTTASFRPYIYISEAHSSRQSKIIQYWSRETGIGAHKFKVIILKSKPKKIYNNHDTYHGVLSLRIVKSTDLKYRIQGLIEACKQAGY